MYFKTKSDGRCLASNFFLNRMRNQFHMNFVLLVNYEPSQGWALSFFFCFTFGKSASPWKKWEIHFTNTPFHSVGKGRLGSPHGLQNCFRRQLSQLSWRIIFKKLCENFKIYVRPNYWKFQGEIHIFDNNLING